MPAQTFFPHSPVEALDEQLLILFVGSCDAVLFAVVPHLLCELGLKLTAAIGLHDGHKAVEAPPHAAMQESRTVFGGQCRSQQNIGFATEDVNRSEGEQATKKANTPPKSMLSIGTT